MKKLTMNKTTAAMLMAMSTLYGCGGSADDPNPNDAVDTRVTTAATLTGTTLVSASTVPLRCRLQPRMPQV